MKNPMWFVDRNIERVNRGGALSSAGSSNQQAL